MWKYLKFYIVFQFFLFAVLFLLELTISGGLSKILVNLSFYLLTYFKLLPRLQIRK